MTHNFKKINNETVKPIKIKKIDKSKIKGRSLFDNLYFNCFICAKKNSGKTTIINSIIDRCTDIRTKIIIFSSTCNKDPSYLHIINNLENKGYEVITYQEINEKKINHLNEIMEVLKENENSNSDNSDSDEKDPYPFINAPYKSTLKKKRKKKYKYIVPEILFIFDDLGTELRDPAIANLLKTHRHYRSCCILSSQYPNDLTPASLRQLDYLLILTNKHDEDKIKKFHNDIGISMDFDKFYNLYQEVTGKEYDFFYIDIPQTQFRKNFNNLITF